MKTQGNHKKVWGKPEVKILSVKIETTAGTAMAGEVGMGGMKPGAS